MRPTGFRRWGGRESSRGPADLLRGVSHKLEGPEDLDPLLERIGEACCVLLGEASHGTSEYYAWRARISERLIREKGFSFIAVEGDWPDCYEVNRCVKGYPDSGKDAREALRAFERWPTWMWANEEVASLTEMLRGHNRDLPEEGKIGLYGLDVYSLRESMDEIISYLERADPAAVPTARRAYGCFEPYGGDAREYARATAFVPTSCEEEVVSLLSELRGGGAARYGDDPEARFAAEQNALVVKNAEAYYRAMVRGGAASWNVRDRHMAETLERLMQHHGAEAKGIVWAHNTHIGDARHTDMARSGMVNVGQLVREQRGEEDVVLVGFGSYRGSVIAGARWGAPMERMTVPPAREGSWEDVMHAAGEEDRLLIFSGARADGLLEPRAHRAIGVVYDPTTERHTNYVPTVLPLRYDAFVYLDETEALHAFEMRAREDGEPPETFPSGE